MPTYEYQCAGGHVFEKFQKMSDRPLAKCPVCGKPATRKISGGVGLVFKGTGFYITDYGKDGKGPRRDGAEKADRPEKADKADKAEAKPASSETRKPEAGPAKPAPKGKAPPE